MELTLDDLIEKCSECNGTGKGKEEPEKRGGHSYGVTPLGSSQASDDCRACGGSGRTKLTETGRAIKEFIEILEKKPLLKYS
jgi:hypothetical protein